MSYIFIFLWFISLSMIISWFIHVAANGNISFFFMTNTPFHSICHIFVIHSFVNGHLDCLAIINSAAIIYLLFSIKIFYWSIINLQYCVNFRCTAQWFNYIYSFSNYFPLRTCVHVCSVMSDSLQSHGLTRLLCPWNFPSKNTGVGCHFLLQGIFSTQGLNPVSPASPALADRFFTTERPVKAFLVVGTS